MRLDAPGAGAKRPHCWRAAGDERCRPAPRHSWKRPCCMRDRRHPTIAPLEEETVSPTCECAAAPLSAPVAPS